MPTFTEKKILHKLPLTIYTQNRPFSFDAKIKKTLSYKVFTSSCSNSLLRFNSNYINHTWRVEWLSLVVLKLYIIYLYSFINIQFHFLFKSNSFKIKYSCKTKRIMNKSIVTAYSTVSPKIISYYTLQIKF